jgi:hypothetical protein
MAEQLVRRGKCWYYRFTDGDGVRRMRKGCADKRVTEEMFRRAETEAAKIRSGLLERREKQIDALPLRLIDLILGSRLYQAVDPETDQWRSIPPSLASHEDRIVELGGPAPCVYFLVRDDVVVYVGQTVNLHVRVVAHRRDKQFDRVLYLPTRREDLIQTEADFIARLQPEYNSHGKGE